MALVLGHLTLELRTFPIVVAIPELRRSVVRLRGLLMPGSALKVSVRWAGHRGDYAGCWDAAGPMGCKSALSFALLMWLLIAVLVVLAAGVLAAVIPTLPSTGDVVVVIVIAVVVIGFVIFVWSQGGSASRGGWRGRGRMG